MAFPKTDKDPEAVLDYPFVWYTWLGDSDTIASHQIIADTGITVDSSGVNSSPVEIDEETYPAGTVVIVWLSGGKAGKSYNVTCRVVTNGGRTDDRTRTIRCVNR